MALLAPQQEDFKRARTSAEKMQDPCIRQRTVDWQTEQKSCGASVTKVAHSIVVYDGLARLPSRSGDLRRMETREIVELAEQAREHAEEGNYRSIYVWRRALGVEPGDVEPAWTIHRNTCTGEGAPWAGRVSAWLAGQAIATAILPRAPAACLFQDHHSAGTLRSDQGFPGSPGLPNRASQGGTSKVWPRANCAPSSTSLESG
jgi:hypothetical protein